MNLSSGIVVKLETIEDEFPKKTGLYSSEQADVDKLCIEGNPSTSSESTKEQVKNKFDEFLSKQTQSDKEDGIIKNGTNSNNFSSVAYKEELPIKKKMLKNNEGNFCQTGDERFSLMGISMKHMGNHTGKRTYSCDICDKSYLTSRTLKCHMRSHTGERPYSCDICDKTFSQFGTLNRHMRSHTGERPYSCDICHKTFSQSGHLKIHIEVHTRDRPYSCDICDKSFSQSGHLKSHIQVHTGDRPYSCDICGKSFSQSSSLKKHLRIHRKY